jgi:hypothetical protein
MDLNSSLEGYKWIPVASLETVNMMEMWKYQWWDMGISLMIVSSFMLI